MSKKLIITAVLAAVMLTACGESTEQNGNTDTAESTAAVASQNESEASESTFSETAAEEETSHTAEALPEAEMPEPFETECDDDSRDGFYLPFNSTLNNIPIELMKLRDSDKVDSWLNSFSSSEKTKLGDYQNLYSFITAFDITKDEAETAFAPYIDGAMMTSEQVDILFSGSEEAVTSGFASKYSVVVGENAYCPYWLYSNTIDDYKAAGIDAEAVKAKAPLYSDFAFSEEARKAFSEKLSEFIGEEVVIEPITFEEKDAETDVIFDVAEEDTPDDEAEDIIIEE